MRTFIFRYGALLFISIAFCWGLLNGFELIGPGDWDQHLFYHGAPAKIISEYGQFPLWNPYYCGGNPLLANPQSPFLSPFILPILVFGEVIGLKLSIIAHIFIGLIGCYHLSRRMGLNAHAAYVPGLVFMLSGIFALHLSEGHTTWLPMAYIPWAFLFYLRTEDSIKNTIGAGAILALMLFEGGAMILLYSLLFLAVYSLIDALISRKIRPVISVTLIFALFFALSAIKLIPMFEFTASFPRDITDTNMMTPLLLYKSLLGLDQLHDSRISGMMEGWWEYGAYIGPVVLFLYLVSFIRTKKWLALRITGLVFLLIALGSTPYFDLWGLLQKVPGFTQQRVSPRYLIYFVFTVALLSGMGFSMLFERGRDIKPTNFMGALKGRLHGGVMLTVILLNLFLIVSPALNIFSFTLPETRNVTSKADSGDGSSFTQRHLRRSTAAYGPASAMYPALIAGEGVRNCYETMNIGKNVYPVEDRRYRGEYYLKDYAEDSSVYLKKWSPGRLVYDYDVKRESTLIVNQNYHTGWKSNLPVKDTDGRLSVTLAQGKGTVELYYAPGSFYYGLIISLLSLGGVILFLWRTCCIRRAGR